jgi:hypothetical protein
MKPLYIIGISFWLMSSCGGSAERKVTEVNRPGETEFTATRHVKKRDGKENKKRYQYYNSLQYKGAYKQL